MNVVVLIGRLTKDPELKYTPAGKAVCQMRLAVDRGVKDSEGKGVADFVDVIAWEKLAENAANYLEKGRLIAINGRLQSRSYDAQDGTRRSVIEIVARNVQFLERKKEGSGGVGSEIPPPDDDVPF